MSKEIDDIGLRIYLSYEDERYPTLVIFGNEFGMSGYSLNKKTGDLRRVCICRAEEEESCVCGYYGRMEV